MDPLLLEVPSRGPLLALNSPADHVPSHGTDLFATTYAIDLLPVDEAGRSAPRTLSSWLTSEPPERFVGFGRPVLSPVAGSSRGCTTAKLTIGRFGHLSQFSPTG